MKALLALFALSFGFQSQAATKSLLYCKNIDKDDLKSITIQKNDDVKIGGILELVENHSNGPAKEVIIPEQDFRDGYVNISSNGATDRILLRRNEKWSVAELRGDYRIVTPADCVME
ncbi:MAG: hypothetical protein ACM3MG_06025 [Bacillota bacterium]